MNSRGVKPKALELGHLRAEPALECGGLTGPFSLNTRRLRMSHRLAKALAALPHSKTRRSALNRKTDRVRPR